MFCLQAHAPLSTGRGFYPLWIVIFSARKNALGLGTVACTSGVVCAGDARLTSTCIAATAKLRALAAQLGVPPQAMVSAVDVHGRADAALLPEASPASGTAAESIVAAAAAGKDITF
jgi:hypothetical protein